MENAGRVRTLSVADAAVLLINTYRAKSNDKIGHEDCARTFRELVESLAVTAKVRESAVESALWACNMLGEEGEFWHPEGRSFEEFSKHIGPFDRNYNYFKD